jgi:hypothetical protein
MAGTWVSSKNWAIAMPKGIFMEIVKAFSITRISRSTPSRNS